MLNKAVVKWFNIAFEIATPIAFYSMYKWLENYACKTSLKWWIIPLPEILEVS
jgi:putative ABC transport system permease protein